MKYAIVKKAYQYDDCNYQTTGHGGEEVYELPTRIVDDFETAIKIRDELSIKEYKKIEPFQGMYYHYRYYGEDGPANMDTDDRILAQMKKDPSLYFYVIAEVDE